MSEKRTSFAELQGKYFGVELNTPSAPSQRITQRLGELTPTAKYITLEAKKRIGRAMSGESKSFIEEEKLFELVKEIEEGEGEELSERERTSVVAALNASLEHYDILTPLIERNDVNDIIVRSYRDISIQIGRRNVQTDLSFSSHETYRAFIENLLKRVGKACTLASPVVDAAIDPDIRACVTHESFSPDGSGPMLTLRIVRHPHVGLETLASTDMAPRVIIDYLSTLVESGQASFLISGEVGTGKTTLVKALISRIPLDEALLIIEDTHEIVVDRNFTRTLLTREANSEGAGRIRPAQAIRTGMRMAMNRIILGEMRDGEAAEAFVDVCASGHIGMSTIHGRSARDALSRLELFLLRAQPGVGVETVRREITNAISVVVHLGLDQQKKERRILQVLEVGSSADGSIQLSPIFSYIGDGRWRRDAGISGYRQELEAAAVRLGAAGTICGEITGGAGV
jgi:pilus assembly protein CpaF